MSGAHLGTIIFLTLLGSAKNYLKSVIVGSKYFNSFLCIV